MMSDLERLVAIEEIKAMRLKLFRALDLRDYPVIGSLITKDMKMIFADDSGHGMPEIVTEGVDAFCAHVKRHTGTGNMVHLATMPQITMEGPDKAHGSWVVEGCIAGDKEAGTSTRMGYETIEDEYVRVDGKWLVSFLHARIQAIVL